MNVNIVTMNQYTQFLGTLGVIASLIFVGLELRQNQQIAIAGQVQERFNTQAQMLLSPLQDNRDMLRIMTVGLNKTENQMTEDERLAYMQLNRWRVASTVNIFTQYQMGMLPDGTFEQVFLSITRMYENCLLRPIINLYATPGYQEFLTTLDNPCDK